MPQRLKLYHAGETQYVEGADLVQMLCKGHKMEINVTTALHLKYPIAGLVPRADFAEKLETILRNAFFPTDAAVIVKLCGEATEVYF